MSQITDTSTIPGRPVPRDGQRSIDSMLNDALSPMRQMHQDQRRIDTENTQQAFNRQSALHTTVKKWVDERYPKLETESDDEYATRRKWAEYRTARALAVRKATREHPPLTPGTYPIPFSAGTLQLDVDRETKQDYLDRIHPAVESYLAQAGFRRPEGEDMLPVTDRSLVGGAASGVAREFVRSGYGMASAIVGGAGYLEQKYENWFERQAGIQVFTEDATLLRAARAIQEQSDTLTRYNPRLRESTDLESGSPQWFAERGFGVVGQVAAMLIPGAGAGKAARLAGLGAKGAERAAIAGASLSGASLEANNQYVSEYARLREAGHGHDEAQDIAAKSAIAYGAVSAVLEAIPMSEFMRTGTKPADLRGQIVSWLTGIQRAAAAEGLTEAAQELASSGVSDLIANNPEAYENLVTRMTEAGMLGAFGGGAVKTVQLGTAPSMSKALEAYVERRPDVQNAVESYANRVISRLTGRDATEFVPINPFFDPAEPRSVLTRRLIQESKVRRGTNRPVVWASKDDGVEFALAADDPMNAALKRAIRKMRRGRTQLSEAEVDAFNTYQQQVEEAVYATAKERAARGYADQEARARSGVSSNPVDLPTLEAAMDVLANGELPQPTEDMDMDAVSQLTSQAYRGILSGRATLNTVALMPDSTAEQAYAKEWAAALLQQVEQRKRPEPVRVETPSREPGAIETRRAAIREVVAAGTLPAPPAGLDGDVVARRQNDISHMVANGVTPAGIDLIVNGQTPEAEFLRQWGRALAEQIAQQPANIQTEPGQPTPTEATPGVQVGDWVQWTSGGVEQFAEPRQVTGVSDDGAFVFVTGSSTGIPASELSSQEPQEAAGDAAAPADPEPVEIVEEDPETAEPPQIEIPDVPVGKSRQTSRRTEAGRQIQVEIPVGESAMVRGVSEGERVANGKPPLAADPVWSAFGSDGEAVVTGVTKAEALAEAKRVAGMDELARQRAAEFTRKPKAGEASRQAIRRRIAAIAGERLYAVSATEELSALEMKLEEDGIGIEEAFIFPGKLPTEIRESVANPTEAARLFTVSSNPRGARGNDAMSLVGAEALVEAARLFRGGDEYRHFKIGMRHREADPELNLLAYTLDAMEVYGEENQTTQTYTKDGVERTRRHNPAMPIEVVDNPAALPDGTTFEIGGQEFMVLTGPTGGRYIDGDGTFPVPEFIESIIIDRGTLDVPATPEESLSRTTDALGEQSEPSPRRPSHPHRERVMREMAAAFTPEEAQVAILVADAYARSWAQGTGKPLDAYYEGLVVVKGGTPSESALYSTIAWHGSRHQFDSFDISMIGAGEGAQAYGWGLYFAEKKGVASYYKKAGLHRDKSAYIKIRGQTLQELSEDEMAANNPTILQAAMWIDSEINMHNKPVASAIATAVSLVHVQLGGAHGYGSAQSRVMRYMANGASFMDAKSAARLDLQMDMRNRKLSHKWAEFRAELNAIDRLRSDEIPDAHIRAWSETLQWVRGLSTGDIELPAIPRGSLYRVELAPRDDEYLLWDAPFNEQSPHVQEVLRRELGDDDFVLSSNDPWRLGESLYKRMEVVHGGAAEASKYLHSIGIKGVKYLDGTSRDLGRGTYNYVIFDDADIKVLERFQKGDGDAIQGSYEISESGDRIIRALQSPDQSTLVHELAHDFLVHLPEIDADLAERAARALGAEEFYDLTVEQEEKFARGFETYLRDGKAPSSSLEWAFQRFRDWLAAIYRSIIGTPLEGKLNPELRAVFDEMLTRGDQSGGPTNAGVFGQQVTDANTGRQRGLFAGEGRGGAGFDLTAGRPQGSEIEQATAAAQGTIDPETGRLFVPEDWADEDISDIPFDMEGFNQVTGFADRPVNNEREYREAVETANEGDLTEPEPVTTGLFPESPDAPAVPNPIPIPEMYLLAKAIRSGEVKLKVNKRLREAFGAFDPGRKTIHIRPDLGQRENRRQLAKTLAHEIGHLIDFLPDEDLSRGNLIGRLRKLHKFGKRFVGTLDNKELRAELWDLSRWWKPFDESAAPPSYVQYRRSAVELYADFISVLFNAPGEARARAPQFYAEFFASLDNNPEVRDAFMDVQDLLAGVPAEVLANRRNHVNEWFKKAEDRMYQRRMELKLARRSMKWQIAQKMLDTSGEVVVRARQLEKAGISRDRAMAARYALEEMRLMQNPMTLFMDDIDSQVMPFLLGDETHPDPKRREDVIEQFGDFLLWQRIITQRKDIINPMGLGPTEAVALLRQMRADIGAEAFGRMAKAANLFHDLVFREVERGFNAGLYSEEVYKNVLLPNRRFYSAFQVVEHATETMDSSLRKQVGTFKEVMNPFTATVLKTVAIIRATEINQAKRELMSWMNTYYGDEVIDHGVLRPFQREPVPDRALNREIVSVMQDGKRRVYEVDKWVADTLKSHDVGSFTQLVDVLAIQYKIFHPLFVQYSPTFAVRNLVRDFGRTWKNVGATVGEVIKAYWDVKGSAWRRANGIDDALVNEMLASRALDQPFVQFDPTEDAIAYDRLLERAGLRHEPRKAWGVVGSVLDLAESATLFSESLGKLAGYRLIQQHDARRVAQAQKEGITMTGMSRRELAFRVRNQVGTPNYRQKGLWGVGLNALFMYSNVRIQGLRGDIEAAVRQEDTRFSWWMKTAMLELAPKLLMKAAALGLMGEWLKEWFDLMPEYEKTNYLLIPLGFGVDEYGNRHAHGFRIPHTDTGQLLSGLLWKVVDVEMLAEIGMTPDYFMELAKFGKDQGMPNFNPALNIGFKWTSFFAGGNPRDDFYGRDIIEEDSKLLGFKERFMDMAMWTGRQFGEASTIIYGLTAPGDDHTNLEIITKSIPGPSRAFFTSSNRGLSERQYKAVTEADKIDAMARHLLPESARRMSTHYHRLRKIAVSDASKLSDADKRELLVTRAFYTSAYAPARRAMEEAIRQEDRDAQRRIRDWLAARADQARQSLKSASERQRQ